MDSHETWQVDVENRVYEATLAEIFDWITEGAVHPADKVRRGDLRWLEAGKVPEFKRHFQLASGIPTAGSDSETAHIDVATNFPNLGTGDVRNLIMVETIVAGEAMPDVLPLSTGAPAPAGPYRASLKFCAVHEQIDSQYYCGICNKAFCGACPRRFGGAVKLCPVCGGMCVIYDESTASVGRSGALNKPYHRKDQSDGKAYPFFDAKLRFQDFKDASLYPFRWLREFVLWSIFFAVLGCGLSTILIGGLGSIPIAVGCALIGTTFLFRSLFKISESVKRSGVGKGLAETSTTTDRRQGFGWAFVSGLGVWVASFGLFATIMLGAMAYTWMTFTDTLIPTESVMTSAGRLSTSFANTGQIRSENDLSSLIQQRRQAVVNSVFGPDYDDSNSAVPKAIRNVIRLSVSFLAPLGLAFLFGFIIFPGACANALSARSFIRIINPIAVFQTIRRLGIDYINLLMIGIVAMLLWVSSLIACVVLIPADLSPVGGLAITVAVASMLGAYIWLVYAKLLALAAHRRPRVEVELTP